jgi:hypothetical protein
MLSAPQQDWSMYESRTREENAEWIRGLSPNERFAIYESLFNALWAVPRGAEENERLDRRRWEQKLAQRLRAVDAFSKMDQIRSERAAATNAG